MAVLLAVYWLTLAVGTLALIGFKTRPNLLAFAFGNVFLQAFAYSFGDFHHPEGLMIITLFALALGPAGQVLSLDDLWRRIQNSTRKGKLESYSILDEKSRFARWPLLLTQWMYALIYLSATISKLTFGSRIHLDWLNGYSLQYYLLQDGLRWGSELGLWLGQQHTLAKFLSWLTILFEGTFFLAVLFPLLAWLYVPTGLAFHMGIFLTQRAPFFQFMAIYIVFTEKLLPPRVVTGWLHPSDSSNKLKVFYAGHCLACIRFMTVVQYFDWFNRLQLDKMDNAQGPPFHAHTGKIEKTCPHTLRVLLPDGSMQRGVYAYREILKQLPLFSPLALLLYIQPFSF